MEQVVDLLINNVKRFLVFTISLTSFAYGAGEYDCVYKVGFPKVLATNNCSRCMCVAEIICKSVVSNKNEITVACPSMNKQCPDAESCLKMTDDKNTLRHYSTVKNDKGEYDFDYDSPTTSAAPYNPPTRLGIWTRTPHFDKSSKRK
jgi:hypothetical protein